MIWNHPTDMQPSVNIIFQVPGNHILKTTFFKRVGFFLFGNSPTPGFVYFGFQAFRKKSVFCVSEFQLKAEFFLQNRQKQLPNSTHFPYLQKWSISWILLGEKPALIHGTGIDEFQLFLGGIHHSVLQTSFRHNLWSFMCLEPFDGLFFWIDKGLVWVPGGNNINLWKDSSPLFLPRDRATRSNSE